MRLYQFSEIITDVTSKFQKVKASEYKSEGQYKIIDQGQKEIAGYTDDESLVNTTNLPIIIFGDHTRNFKYVDSPIALGADGVKALSVNLKFAHSLYVYYYLRTVNLEGAGYSRHFKFLKQVEIPIPEKEGEPDFDDQKRISHLLGKVEGLLARRKQHLQHLDDLLKSIFLEMFGDPVRNERQWNTKPLGKLATIERGRFSPRPRNDPKFYNGNYPFIQTGDISHSNGRLREYTQTLNDLGIKVSKKFDVGTIVIAIVGATIGETAILEMATYAPDSVIGITPKIGDKKTESIFIEFLLRFWKPVLKAKAPEAARANINIETLRPMPIIWPLEHDRENFVAIVERVEGLKSHYQQSLTDLNNLYGALSQKAFKGELDLSRVTLPKEDNEAMSTNEEREQITEDFPSAQSWKFSTTNADQPQNREQIIKQWLHTFIGQVKFREFISIQDFMTRASGMLREYSDEGMLDELGIEGEDELTVSDYDCVKSMIFEMVKNGSLCQEFDSDNKTIHIVSGQG